MLEFDAYQRCETAKRILKRLVPEGGARVLDVGGYPGRMRTMMPNYAWTICDPLVDSAGDFIRGSAAQLPFQDRTFAFAAALDVLEHIPPQDRADSIKEMVRVSRNGILLTFPYLAAHVEQAESILCTLYESRHDGEKHPWLSEHRDNTLPDENGVLDILNGCGGFVQTYSLGSIDRWTRLQSAGIVLEDKPELRQLEQDIDGIYRERLYELDFVEPCYRKVVVFTPDQVEPLEISKPNPQQERLADLEIERLLIQANLSTSHQSHSHSSLPTGSFDDIPLEEYIHRLEKGLQFWENTYTQTSKELIEMMKWRDRLEHRAGFRAYRKLANMLGKHIDG